jgi:hypothetical protein
MLTPPDLYNNQLTWDFRNQQVHQRVDEVKRTLDVITRINKGDYVENILQADNNKTEMNLAVFKDAFDLSNPILCGKSNRFRKG